MGMARLGDGAKRASFCWSVLVGTDWLAPGVYPTEAAQPLTEQETQNQWGNIKSAQGNGLDEDRC